MKEKVLRSNSKYGEKVAALLSELSKVSEEALNRQPAGKGWSAAQTAWHLLLVEELAFQYVQKKLGYGGDFQKVGFSAHWRNFLLHIAMLLPVKYKAPKTSSGDNLPEHITFADINERWISARSNWTDFLSQLPDNLVDKAVFKHPRAGKIGWGQMLVFFATHFDRHLLQIKKALA